MNLHSAIKFLDSNKKPKTFIVTEKDIAKHQEFNICLSRLVSVIESSESDVKNSHAYKAARIALGLEK